MADGKKIRKIFITDDGSALRSKPHEIYWIPILNGWDMLTYKQEYTAPPTSLRFGSKGRFKEVSSDKKVVFRYDEPIFINGGFITAGMVALMGSAIMLGWAWTAHAQRPPKKVKKKKAKK